MPEPPAIASREVVGVVLAAGTASRFGSPKQLLRFAGRPLVERVVRNAAESALDRVVVVLGSSAEEVREHADFGRAEVVDNRKYGAGCASSLVAGLAAAGDCAALMLLLGDQPGVRAPVIDHVLADWRAEPVWAAVTDYRGEPGHPFVFARAAFDDLGRLHGDKAIWKLIERFPERVRRIGIDLELPPDIDRSTDLERALAHWRRAVRENSC